MTTLTAQTKKSLTVVTSKIPLVKVLVIKKREKKIVENASMAAPNLQLWTITALASFYLAGASHFGATADGEEVQFDLGTALLAN